MNLEKLAQEIAMCKSPNVDKWLVPIVDLEGMIALIQRQESELAASRDENEALKAARQPLADSFVAPVVAVDAPTIWTLSRESMAMVPNSMRMNPNENYWTVSDATAHTARAVAAKQAIIDRLMLEYCPDEMTAEQVETWGNSQRCVPEAAQPSYRYIRSDEICIVGRAHDGKTPDIDLPIFGNGSKDGKRLFVVALPAPQPVAGELPPLSGDSTYDRLSSYLDQRAAQPVQQPAAVGEPERFDTEQSREYLVQFMEQHFTDKTYHRYIRGGREKNNLAGDFAWQMARALRIITAAAPAAGVQGDDGSEAVRLLGLVFDAWENGDECYEDPDNHAGFLGNAFQLDDEVFKQCCDLLNRRNPPRNATPSQPDSGRDAEQAFEDGKRLAHEQATVVTHALMAERDEWKAKATAKDSGRDAALAKFFEALRQIDLYQFNANREPCWNIHEDGRFCGRAKSWAGHKCGYKYVSMTDAIKDALAAHPANGAQACDCDDGMRWVDGCTQPCEKCQDVTDDSAANGAQAGKEPHWLDSPQSALGGKTARQGYATNPDYSGAQAGDAIPKEREDDEGSCDFVDGWNACRNEFLAAAKKGGA